MIAMAARGDLSHLVVVGADLTTSSLDPETLQRAFENATSVAFMSHRSEMEALCDVTLPIATHAERMGTFTNYAGVVQRFNRVTEPMGESRTLLSVLAAVGGLAGIDLPDANPTAIFERLAGEVEEMKGLSYSALAEKERVEPADSQWTNDYVVPQL
jgi:formate dehydrogenase major subunit